MHSAAQCVQEQLEATLHRAWCMLTLLPAQHNLPSTIPTALLCVCTLILRERTGVAAITSFAASQVYGHQLHAAKQRYGVLRQDHDQLVTQLAQVEAQLNDSDARRCVYGLLFGGCLVAALLLGVIESWVARQAVAAQIGAEVLSL